MSWLVETDCLLIVGVRRKRFQLNPEPGESLVFEEISDLCLQTEQNFSEPRSEVLKDWVSVFPCGNGCWPEVTVETQSIYHRYPCSHR